MNIKDKLNQEMNDLKEKRAERVERMKNNWSDMNIFEKILTGIVGGVVVILITMFFMVIIIFKIIVVISCTVLFILVFPIVRLVEIIKGTK